MPTPLARDGSFESRIARDSRLAIAVSRRLGPDRPRLGPAEAERRSPPSKIDEALRLLACPRAGRAEQIQLLLSLPYEPDWKGQFAWQDRS